MQKGIVPLYILVVVLIASLVGGTLYFKQTQGNPISPDKPTATATTSANLPTSHGSTVKKESPKASPLPTNQKEITSKNNTCAVNIIYGKLGGDSSNLMLVTSVASLSSKNGSYLTGAQWDFDGNNSWDTDLKQSNTPLEHTYTKSGTYNVRLQVKASDNSLTEICSKSVTVPSSIPSPSGITIKMTGTVYADTNCNNLFEPNEKGIVGAKVLIMKMPEYSIYAELTTESSGNYGFSKNVVDFVSLSPTYGQVPDGYKSNPKWSVHTFAMGSSQSSTNVDIPLVPYENVSSCF